MTHRHNPRDGFGAAVVGVAVMLVCCAVPVLLVGGGLAAAAVVLRDFWLAVVSAVVLAVVVGGRCGGTGATAATRQGRRDWREVVMTTTREYQRELGNSGRRRAVMTVGELSRRTGVTVKALRRYEGMGLIYTLGRSATGYRLFDQTALWCVQLITGLRALGLTEAQIQQLAHHAEQPEQLVGPYLAELLGDVRARTEARIDELQQVLDRIDAFETRHRDALAGEAETEPWGPNPRRCAVPATV